MKKHITIMNEILSTGDIIDLTVKLLSRTEPFVSASVYLGGRGVAFETIRKLKGAILVTDNGLFEVHLQGQERYFKLDCFSNITKAIEAVREREKFV